MRGCSAAVAFAPRRTAPDRSDRTSGSERASWQDLKHLHRLARQTLHLLLVVPLEGARAREAAGPLVQQAPEGSARRAGRHLGRRPTLSAHHCLGIHGCGWLVPSSKPTVSSGRKERWGRCFLLGKAVKALSLSSRQGRRRRRRPPPGSSVAKLNASRLLPSPLSWSRSRSPLPHLS